MIDRLKNDDALGRTARHFLCSLSQSHGRHTPFDHWLLDDVLPDAIVDSITGLPLPPPLAAEFDGTREVNNSSRVFFSREYQERYPVCREVAEAFHNDHVVGAIQTITGAQAARGRLRIEYCQDINGFWLAPHRDIAAKLFTLIVYLSGEPALRDAGTDIYDTGPDHRLVSTVPYEKGTGLIFIPGPDTWHGFTRRPICGIRKSLIVNYVVPEWRALHELA